jgi:hypothetical protein
MAVATLCKYQSIVICLTLLTITLIEKRSWKQLIPWAMVAGTAMTCWLVFALTHNTQGLALSGNRFAWGQAFLPMLESTHGCSLAKLVFIGLTDLSLPVLMLAAIGLVQQRGRRPMPALGCYLVLTLAFNLAAAALPGGFGNYLIPVYLPLAASAGMAFADGQVKLPVAALLLGLAVTKSFVPLPVVGAVKVGVALAGLALIGCVLRFRRAPALFIVAMFIYTLPMSLPI